MAVFLGVDLSAYTRNSKEYRNVKRIADFLHDASNASRSQAEEPGTPGGGASIDASYITVEPSTVLTKERVLVALDPLTLSDLGPNQSVRLDLNVDSVALDVFLRADGSIVGTGTQEFSNITPLDLSAQNPVINYGIGGGIGSILKFQGRGGSIQDQVTFASVTGSEALNIELQANGNVTVTGLTQVPGVFKWTTVGAKMLVAPEAQRNLELVATGTGGNIFIDSALGDVTIAAPNGFFTFTDSTTLPTETLKTLASGAGTIVTAADVAYRIETTAADLTLKTITSGDIILDPAGVVSILGSITAESITLSSTAPITLLANSNTITCGTTATGCTIFWDSLAGVTGVAHIIRHVDSGNFINISASGSGTTVSSFGLPLALTGNTSGISFGDFTTIGTNVKHNLGTNNEAEFFYNGTNLIIDPDVVGSGALAVGGDILVGSESGPRISDTAGTFRVDVGSSNFAFSAGGTLAVTPVTATTVINILSFNANAVTTSNAVVAISASYANTGAAGASRILAGQALANGAAGTFGHHAMGLNLFSIGATTGAWGQAIIGSGDNGPKMWGGIFNLNFGSSPASIVAGTQAGGILINSVGTLNGMTLPDFAGFVMGAVSPVCANPVGVAVAEDISVVSGKAFVYDSTVTTDHVGSIVGGKYTYVRGDTESFYDSVQQKIIFKVDGVLSAAFLPETMEVNGTDIRSLIAAHGL